MAGRLHQRRNSPVALTGHQTGARQGVVAASGGWDERVPLWVPVVTLRYVGRAGGAGHGRSQAGGKGWSWRLGCVPAGGRPWTARAWGRRGHGVVLVQGAMAVAGSRPGRCAREDLAGGTLRARSATRSSTGGGASPEERGHGAWSGAWARLWGAPSQLDSQQDPPHPLYKTRRPSSLEETPAELALVWGRGRSWVCA